MVCLVCSDLQPAALEYLTGEQRAQLWTNVDDLARARDAGCIHCTLVLEALLAYKPIWSSEESALHVEIQMARGKPLRVFFRPQTLYIEIFRPRSTATDAAEHLTEVVGPAVHVTEYSGGPECLALGRSWLSECLTTHAQCVAKAQAILPTRVVALNRDDGKLSIHLADGLGRQGSYAALSYCWGPFDASSVSRTLLGNITEHRRGIEINSLSTTLQNAVEIIANLGFSNLWVDALCIIQDDNEDWERESAKMCDVYSGATLTIVAAGSDSSAKGIYQHQAFHECHKLIYNGSTVLARPHLTRYHSQFSEIEIWPLVPDPLHLRAWALQEILLSNRALVFSGEELRWYCNQLRNCECEAVRTLPGYDSDLRSEADIGTAFRMPRYFERSPAIMPDPDTCRTRQASATYAINTAASIYQTWDQAVGIFTTRLLSYEQDRLTAISGLARRFADFAKDVDRTTGQYLAGLWAGSLPMSLLWGPEFNRGSAWEQNARRCRRPARWRAPSWSWAALEGPIIFPPHLGMLPTARVVSCITVLQTTDPYGQVSSGTLTLEGRTIHNVSAVTNIDGTTHRADVDYSQYPTNSLKSAPFQLKAGDTWFCHFTPDQLEEIATNAAELTLVEVGRRVQLPIAAGDPGYVFAFLVLRALPNRDVFERVGVAVYDPIYLKTAHHDAARRLVSSAVEEVVIVI